MVNTVPPGRVPTLALFILVSLAWGSSFLFIKVAGEGFSAAQVMVGRLTVGAAFLALIMLVTRRKWPREPRTLGALLLISVFLCVIPFTLYAWAGQHLPSGLSSIYNAATPIATLLVGLAILPDEKITRNRVIGLLVAAAGIVILAAPWTFAFDTRSGLDVVLAQAAALGANLCYAIAYVLTRRLIRAGTYDSTTIAATQIGLAALVGLAISPFIGGLAPVTVSWPSIWSLLTLGLLSTGIVYIWHATIIREWGATAGSTVTYATPIVGVILGILILGETLHWNEPTGGALVLLGVLIGRLPARRGARAGRVPDGEASVPS